MARKILIVGAGQSGLQLALGLQQYDYDVTVMSARTAEEIRAGRVMSTHGGAVPWWRVIHSDGSMVPCHERAALRQYKKEGTPLRASADGATFRVDMRRARWRGLEAASLEAPGPGDLELPD